MKGFYCSIVGIDGTGKTTLVNAIQDSGYDAVYTREPYRRGLAEEYKDDDDNFGVCYSFAVDRHRHMKEIILPSLAHGKTVICDRGLHCNLAYQAYEGASMSWTMKIQSPIMVLPDLIIFLVGKPFACARRSFEYDPNRLAEIQRLYGDAFAQTPKIPVFTINIENANINVIRDTVIKQIDEMRKK